MNGTINPEQLFDYDRASSDAYNYSNTFPYLSPPSLSPSNPYSPPSSASPHSVATDTILSDDLLNGFSVEQIQQLFQLGQVEPVKNEPFYLPDPSFTFEAPKPKAKVARARSEEDEKPVGKHNKTERKYRQKVQAAQSDLRDAVPALRVLYGTSTEEQKRTTDVRGLDGTVDGLGEFNRPNASAKTTIFIGARLYIEHLQRKVATLQRQVDELETFRALVAGQEDLQQWRDDFNARQPVYKPTEESSYGEESEDEQPKKKARVTKKKDLRSFAAFAVLAFLPSWSQPETLVHTYAPATTAQVFERIPTIVSQHTTRLLARVLPHALAALLVSWTWRIAIAWLLTKVFQRIWPRNKVSHIASTLALASIGRLSPDHQALERATQVVGKVDTISRLDRYELSLRLNATANDASSRAVLALLQPTLPLLPSSTDVWAAAKSSITSETPTALRQLLALDLDEAKRALQLLPPTANPLAAMAEQITLVHLNDLVSRVFIHLVDEAASDVPDSIMALKKNLQSRVTKDALRSGSFDKEIRGVIQAAPRGTAAHALGLVLIGIWGIIAGATPSAQASLASALAGEEIQGVGSALQSVSALRELLYPGSGMLIAPELHRLPQNAMTIDKLALVCIRFIELVSSTFDSSAPRLERLAESRRVQKTTEQIRLVLTQTTFSGLDDGAPMDRFDVAREKLVTVLSLVGRRAVGRATGRDEDSGLEGDVEEL